MSVISKTTLRVSENHKALGKITSTSTIIDEQEMEGFVKTEYLNTGIGVKFEYCNELIDLRPKQYEIIANKYAFEKFSNGIYKNNFVAYIRDFIYLFILSVTTNKDNEIELDDGVFVEIYDLKDEETMLAKIKIEDANLIDINTSK